MKRTSAIVVLGGGLLQCPLVTAVNSLGFCSIVVDQNPHCRSRCMAGIFLCISIKEHQNIFASLQRLSHCVYIIDVQTIGTDFTFQRNYLRRALNVERLAVFHLLSSNHKYYMRRFLEELHIAIPTWKKVRTAEDLLSVVSQYKQVVLKPVDNMGARGVKIIDNTSNTQQQLAATLKNSSAQYALAETIIAGQEYSVDVVVNNNAVRWCGIAQRKIILRPYFIEIGHYFSSEIPRTVIRSLKKTMLRIVRAIPARYYQLKFDIFYADGTVYVNEFASRLSGGFMSGWTYPLYSGIRPAELVLTKHAPKKRRLMPFIKPFWYRRQSVGMRTNVVAEGSVISIPGIVHELASLSKIRAIPEVVAVFANISKGEESRFPQNNLDKCFHIIVTAHSSQYDDIFMKIRAYLLPRLAPHHPATERFLSHAHARMRHTAYSLNNPSHQKIIVALVCDLVTTAILSIDSIDVLKMFESFSDWHGIPLSLAIKIMFWKYQLWRLRSEMRNIEQIVVALIKGGLQGALYYIDTIDSDQSVAVVYVDKTDH